MSDMRPLPDIIAPRLSILFVGYNPGLQSASSGHHYAGKSNRFWKLLYQSELLPYPLSSEEDKILLKFGYGSTNIVQRPTKSANEISSEEFKEGSRILSNLIQSMAPKIVCYVGYGVYRAFASNLLGTSASKMQITAGVQQSCLIEGIIDFICSNPSGLNTIPYEQQLRCFISLRELKDSLV